MPSTPRPSTPAAASSISPAPPQPPRPPGAIPPTALPLRYDIQIDAPSTLQVRNNSIRLTARADLQLRGTYDRPLLVGRADVERGEVAFEGRRYLVTRGSIDLSNPTRIEPFIDLETETRVRVPGRYLPRHAASVRHHRSPEPGVHVRPLAAAGRDPGAAVQRRRAGAQHRVPAVQHRHHAAAAAAARARHARPDRAPSHRRSSGWCRRPSAWIPSS